MADGKREELRQLVGVRYRVLLETADSIERMKAEGAMATSDCDNIQVALEALHSLHLAHTQPSGSASTDAGKVGGGSDGSLVSSSTQSRAVSVSLSDKAAPAFASVTAAPSSSRSSASSALSLLRSVSSAPLSLLQSARRRQWLSALAQLSDSRAVLQRLASTANDAGGGVPASRSTPLLLLSADWSHVLRHRSSALFSVPDALHHQAVQALHADVILDVQVHYTLTRLTRSQTGRSLRQCTLHPAPLTLADAAVLGGSLMCAVSVCLLLPVSVRVRVCVAPSLPRYLPVPSGAE